MLVEAEFKALLAEPGRVRERLAGLAPVERVVYRDTYFDDGRRGLAEGGRELRVRTVSGGGRKRHLLTFKDPAVDVASGSKPELETTVADRDVVEEVLARLGQEPVISYSKECENYRFRAGGREVLATVVRVAELTGTFLELETLVGDESGVPEALAELRRVLGELGVSEEELTTEIYTEAVARAR
jgi:adenylate cyclase class 2